MIGRSLRVARDLAEPVVEMAQLADWASEQARLVVAVEPSPPAETQVEVAQTVLQLGGDPATLKIGRANDRWVNTAELASWAARRQQILLVHDAALSNARHDHGKLKLPADTLAVSFSALPVLNTDRFDLPTEALEDWNGNEGGEPPLRDLALRTIADVWGVTVADWDEMPLTTVFAHARAGSYQVPLEVERLERPSPSPTVARRPGAARGKTSARKA